MISMEKAKNLEFVCLSEPIEYSSIIYHHVHSKAPACNLYKSHGLHMLFECLVGSIARIPNKINKKKLNHWIFFSSLIRHEKFHYLKFSVCTFLWMCVRVKKRDFVKFPFFIGFSVTFGSNWSNGISHAYMISMQK